MGWPAIAPSLSTYALHETGTYGRKVGQAATGARARHHALAVLACRQHGVFSLAQLVDLGLSPSAVHKRTTSGRLHRIHRGVYSPVPLALLSRNGRFLAAVLGCGPGAILSHRSAADLHGLRADHRAAIDVTAPGHGRRNHAGVIVHCSRTLTAADITTVAGIPCPTVARTLLNLATALPARPWERAYDQAAILEVLDARAVEDQLHRNPRRSGAPRLRAALQEHRAGSTVTWSTLEERLLAVCRVAGLPRPEVNAWIVPGDDEPAIRVDFLWRDRMVVVETDSHRFHRTRRAFETDRRRDQRLTLAGWKVIRVTWRQLRDEPETVARVIGGLLRTAPGAAAPGGWRAAAPGV